MSVSMSELTGSMCRWPLNDRSEGELKFCGAASNDPAYPYCEEHTAKAHSASRPPKTLSPPKY